MNHCVTGRATLEVNGLRPRVACFVISWFIRANRSGSEIPRRKAPRLEIPKLSVRHFIAILLLLPALTFTLSNAGAAQKNWTGGSIVNSYWNLHANWADGIAPAAGDSLVFQGVASRFTNTNNFPANTVFSGIHYLGSYNVYGNPLSLNGSLSMQAPDGSVTFRPDLRLGNVVQIRNATPGTTFNISSDIDLNGNNPLFLSEGDIILTGVISGAGSVTKDEFGELVFTGSSANTFLGLVNVENGTLRLRKAVSFPVPSGRVSIPGNLTIGNGNAGFASAFVMLEEDNQIANTSAVTVNGTGRLALNGFNDAIGSLTMAGGSVITADGGTIGTLTVNGDIAVSYQGGTQPPSIISGRLNLGSSAQRNINVDFGATVRIDANVVGLAALHFQGFGELWLTRSNSYEGETRIESGLLQVSDSHALGSPSGGTMLTSELAPALRLLGPLTINDEALTAGNNALLYCENGTISWNGPVILNGELFLRVSTNTTLILNEPVSGHGGLVIRDVGVVRFGGSTANTFAGGVAVDVGELQLNKASGNAISSQVIIGDTFAGSTPARARHLRDHQIHNDASVFLYSNGTLDLNGQSEEIGSLGGFGTVELGAGGTLMFGGTNALSAFWGRITEVGHIEKIGIGVMALNSNHTFTGECRVREGTLLINGSIQPSSLVRVSNGATLGGNGIMPDVLILPGGVLSPGTGTGRLTATGSVTLAAGSIFRVEINGRAAGPGYDQLLSSGGIQLGGSTLQVSFGFTPAIGAGFRIIDNVSGSPVAGTFDGLPQDGQFLADNMAFQITYTGGNGNDVVITRIAAPSAGPRLTIEPVPPASVRLRWSTNDSIFGLQFNTNLTTTNWTPATPLPVIAGTNNVVTNAAVGAHRFYRLIGP